MNWSNVVPPACATHTLALLEGTAVAAVLSVSILPVWCNAVLLHSAYSVLQLHSHLHFPSYAISMLCGYLQVTVGHFDLWLPPAGTTSCTPGFALLSKYLPYCSFNKINALNILFHKIFLLTSFSLTVFIWWPTGDLLSLLLSLLSHNCVLTVGLSRTTVPKDSVKRLEEASLVLSLQQVLPCGCCEGEVDSYTSLSCNEKCWKAFSISTFSLCESSESNRTWCVPQCCKSPPWVCGGPWKPTYETCDTLTSSKLWWYEPGRA